MLRFFLTFLVLQLTLFGINMLGVVQQHVILPWTALLARMCAGLVTLFDSTAAAAGKVLWNTVTGFGVSIEPGCNGVEACIVLFAAVIAFPSTWRHKLTGLALGFVAVQALIMLDVLIVWLLWVRAGSKAQAASEPPPPPDEPPAPPPVRTAAPQAAPAGPLVSSSLDLSPPVRPAS